MANSKKTNYRNQNRRTRSYLQIVYEDSMPTNLINILKHEVDIGKMRYVILSPWHDRDLITKEDIDEYEMSLVKVNQNQFNQEWEQRIMQQLYAPGNQLTREQIEENMRKQIFDEELSRKNLIGTYKKKHIHLIGELKNPLQQIYANNYFQRLTNGSFVKPRENLRGAVRYLAHLDEDPSKKALYNPDLIYVYGDIKIDRFLDDEDKSMTSLNAWHLLKDLIDRESIISIVDFEEIMMKQDIDLQLQVQKNVNLRRRCVDYVRARYYEEVEISGLKKGIREVALHNGTTIEKELHNIKALPQYAKKIE